MSQWWSWDPRGPWDHRPVHRGEAAPWPKIRPSTPPIEEPVEPPTRSWWKFCRPPLAFDRAAWRQFVGWLRG